MDIFKVTSQEEDSAAMTLTKNWRNAAGVGFEGQGPIDLSFFYKLSRPILWIQWITGRTPYTIKSGWLRFSVLSFSFVYAVAFRIGIIIVILYNREHFYDHLNNVRDGITFENILFSFLIISQVLHTLIAIYSWKWEVPYIVSSYNATVVLEARARELQLPICKMTRLAVCLTTSVIVSFFIMVVVFAWIILPNQLAEIPNAVIVSYVIVYLINNSFTAMWLFNFFFIRKWARDLLSLTKELLQRSEMPGKQLCEFRRMWLSIWELAQKFAYSIAISISFSLVLNCCTFITSSYGILSLIRLREPIEKVLRVVPYFLASFFGVYSVIDIAHCAKAAMKDEFLKTMIQVESDKIGRECYKEVRLFTKMILEADPKITLLDFFTVDRDLLISFLSCSITYLIVLLQFRINQEQLNPTTSTPGI